MVLYNALAKGLLCDSGGGSGGGGAGDREPEGFMLIVRGGGMLVLGLGVLGCLGCEGGCACEPSSPVLDFFHLPYLRSFLSPFALGICELCRNSTVRPGIAVRRDNEQDHTETSNTGNGHVFHAASWGINDVIVE